MAASRQTPLALVTGGAGFIGRHLCAALLRDAWAVRVCGRSARPDNLPAAVEHQRIDLAAATAADMAGLCEGVGVVFHLAGATSSRSTPEQMHEVNVGGTGRLLEAAARAGVDRFVHASTSSVYGSRVALPQPVTEDAPCHPSPGYGETKWQAEQLVWAADLPATVLRPTTVYGPGAVKLLASTALDAALERCAGLESFAVPEDPVELRMVHVDDVVAALRHLAAAEQAPGRAFNLCAPEYPTSHEVGQLVAEHTGLPLSLTDADDAGLSYEERAAVRERLLAEGMRGDILLQPQRIRFLKKANRNNRLSLSALRGTGFSPRVTDLPGSIRRTLRWYSEQRWLP